MKEDNQQIECPQCHSTTDVVPVAYGMPNPHLLKEAQEGRVYLAGCEIPGNRHSHHCNKCSLEFTAVTEY